MPHPVIIKNLDQPIAVPARVGYCDSFACRLRGLTFRPRLEPDEGLLLVEKRDSRLDGAIHMFFVSFDLAVFWIDSSMTVVDKVRAGAWKPAYFPRQPARYILELHPDRWEDYQIGHKVLIQDA